VIIKELKLREFPYRSRRGLSERLANHYFGQRGYEVFRGTMVLGREFSVNYELYENVKRKYDRLEAILTERLGLRLWVMREELTGGIPDFFVHKPGDCFFAEIKLEHEQIKPHQLQCAAKLEGFGFKVMLLRIKSKPYKLLSNVKLDGAGEKEVLVRQKRFRPAVNSH